MNQPSRALLRVIRVIDGFTTITGWAFATLTVPLVLGVSYEVFARYALNAPTLWAFDLSYMLYGALFMLGAAFALLKGAHIRTDLFWERFSERTKGVIDTIAYLAFFFPGLTLILVTSAGEAWQSFLINEESEQTAWRPILWPFKAVVPLTMVLLLVQGVSEVLKSIYLARTGRRLTAVEVISV